MTATPRDLAGRSLLAVFAHPDDESLSCGGVLAWCAALGARVSICCATRGEMGPGRSADLRETRAKELRNAAHVLGVRDLVLLDYEDGMLPWADAERLEADIRQTIGRLAPDVVITFGEDGLYGHPDHISIHERTTAAIVALGESAPALYYVTMPGDCMAAIVRHVEAELDRQKVGGRAPLRILGITEPDAFGALAAPPTLVVDVGPFAATKLAAIKCHRTQLDDDALAQLTGRDAVRFLGTEQFHRAGVGASGDAFIECLALSSSGGR